MNEEMKYAWGRFVGYRDGWESEFDAWLARVKGNAYDEGYQAGWDGCEDMG